MDNIVKSIKDFRQEYADYNRENIENGRADIRFERGKDEDAWDQEVWHARGKRPKMTVNTMPAKKARIANQLRPLNPEIKVLPVGEEDKERARVRTGLFKSIQKKYGAEAIFDQAFSQMLSTGLSFMHVYADYISPDSYDQDVIIEHLPNWTSVCYDWNYKSPIYKDTMRACFDVDMPKEDYKLKYGGTVSESSMSTLFNTYSEKEADYIKLVQYYEIYESKAKTVLISDGINFLSGYSDDLRIKELLGLTNPEGYEIWKIVEQRSSIKRQLEWYLVNGYEILEKKKDLPGKYIPIVPVEGRIQWIDGHRNIQSYIHNLKAPAQMKNYAKSLEVEMLAYQPLNVWLAAEGSWEDYEEWYRKANNKALPVLTYRPYDDAGNPLPKPERSAYIGPSNQLTTIFQSYDKDINDISGDFDEMSQVNNQLRSGIAIDLKQRAAGVTNYDYLDNFITRSMTYLGIVINDLLPHYYTEDRAYSIIGDEGKKERIEGFDLTGGEYDVEIHIGASSDTERRESLEILKDAVAQIPGAQNLAYLLFKNMDNLKGQEEAVKIMKAMLPPEVLGLLESDESTLAVENGQLKQQLQMTQQQLEQASQLIQSMQIDYKKAMDQTALKGQFDIQKELIKANTTLKDQELQNSGDIMQEVIKHIQLISNKVQELEIKMNGNGESVSIETENET